MVPVPSQELPERCCIQPRTELGTPAPDFSSGLTPEAFPMSWCGRKAAEGFFLGGGGGLGFSFFFFFFSFVVFFRSPAISLGFTIFG